MRATAQIVAEPAPSGRTRLAVLRGEPPLLPRRTGADAAGPAVVHLVGGAAGPLGGDHLRIEIVVRGGAALIVRTVAASVALPGPTGERSRAQVHASVAAGGRLEWLPEPVVAAAGCDHEALSTVELSPDATLVWREVLICGRHGEDPGDLRLALGVNLAGAPLCRHELAVGPRADGWNGPAVLGTARAAGSLLVVGAPAPAPGSGVGWARMSLAGPAVLTTAVAEDAVTLQARLRPA
jgi:urease accessory protein